jgi:hypothetical protein
MPDTTAPVTDGSLSGSHALPFPAPSGIGAAVPHPHSV